MTQKKRLNLKRESNIELLRIFSMLLIVAYHLYQYTEWNFNSACSINALLADLLGLWGKWGVNCFILITGFFSIQNNVNCRKIVKLYISVWFYSVVLSFVFFINDSGIVDNKNMIKAIFPIMFNQYWFATAFFVLLLLSPFINIFIKNINKNTYLKIIYILFVILSCIPTITLKSLEIGRVGWFIFLYLIGGYIRIYGVPKIVEKYIGNIFIGFVIMLCIGTIVLKILGRWISFFETEYVILGYMTSVPLFLCSLSGFIFFLKIRIKTNKFINKIAKTTFGVYLIHDNVAIHQILWSKIIRLDLLCNQPWFIVAYIVAVIVVFLICSLIDTIRSEVFDFIQNNFFRMRKEKQ